MTDQSSSSTQSMVRETWSYACVLVLAAIVGGVLGALVYHWVFPA